MNAPTTPAPTAPMGPVVADERGMRSGLVMGLAAHLIWGLFPLYFAMLDHVPPTVVLGHRVVHSGIAMVLLATLTRQWPTIRRTIADRRTLGLLTIAAVLVAANWLGFIYAVVTGRALEASLGYFIAPLAITMLGVVVLRERLTRVQVLCVALATIAIVVRTAWLGNLPWIALFLPITFGVYSLLRKIARASSQVAMAVETFVLLPVGVTYLAIAYALGRGGPVEATSVGTLALLSISGVLTVTPLLLFGGAAKRLRMVTLGFIQFAGPTCQMILAVTALGETFRPIDALAFGLIWLALILFTLDTVRRERRRRRDIGIAPGLEAD